MKVRIYIETSIRGLRKQDGVVGYVIGSTSTDRTIEQFGTVQGVTEDQSILLALKYASHFVLPGNEVEIYTSSNYIRNAFEHWTTNWIENGFQTAKGKDIKNREHWEPILEKFSEAEVIDGHHEYKNWLTLEIEKRAKKRR